MIEGLYRALGYEYRWSRCLDGDYCKCTQAAPLCHLSSFWLYYMQIVPNPRLSLVKVWVTQKLPQICTVILRIRIGKVA